MPGAEACAVRSVLETWAGKRPLIIVVDASYVIKKLQPHNREAYRKGYNVDIRHSIFELPGAMEVKPVSAKKRAMFQST